MVPIPRLSIPEMPGLGLQETNGWQNYKNWDTMMNYHPAKSEDWTITKNGVYPTEKAFFEMISPLLDKLINMISIRCRWTI